MSSYKLAGPKIEFKDILKDSRISKEADLIAISLFRQNMFLIIKCSHLIQFGEDDPRPLKRFEVVNSAIFYRALVLSETPLVFSSSYLNMEPYRGIIMSYKQELEENNDKC